VDWPALVAAVLGVALVLGLYAVTLLAMRP